MNAYNTYRIVYIEYSRGESERVEAEFNAPNNKLALLKASPFLGGCGSLDYWDEEELKEYARMSTAEIENMIYSSNGDGQDYLISCTNAYTKETIFRDDASSFQVLADEDWDTILEIVGSDTEEDE